MTRFQKIAIGIGGLTALVIGGFILFAPHAFYAGYGIALGQDPDRLSELRAPGANLAALGGVMLAGLRRPALSAISMIVAATVFSAFAFGRLVSIALDGVPSGGILGALVIELFIAGLCIAALSHGRTAIAAQARLSDMPG